jgi:hypothetical protein
VAGKGFVREDPDESRIAWSGSVLYRPWMDGWSVVYIYPFRVEMIVPTHSQRTVQSLRVSTISSCSALQSQLRITQYDDCRVQAERPRKVDPSPSRSLLDARWRCGMPLEAV